MTRGPITVSHQGKIVLLHGDGRKTNPDGSPVHEKPDKPVPEAPKRWHDPYA